METTGDYRLSPFFIFVHHKRKENVSKTPIDFSTAFAVFTTPQIRHSKSVILNDFTTNFTAFQLFVVSLPHTKQSDNQNTHYI